MDGLAGASKPMTQAERETQERKKMLLEKMRLKKEKEAAGAGSVVRGSSVPSKAVALQQSASSSSSAGPSKPPASGGPGHRASAPTLAPVGEGKPMSYKEKLAMAAKLQEEKKRLGAITHKPRAPVVGKKEYLRRLEARQQTKGSSASGGTATDRKSRSPGISGGERTGTASSRKPTGKETAAKAGPLRKAVGGSDSRRSSTSRSKPTDKARPAEAPVKRKRSPSPISWRGRNPKAPSTTKANRSRAGRGRYGDEEDDDDDDWIVDDDESEDGRRGGSYGKQ